MLYLTSFIKSQTENLFNYINYNTFISNFKNTPKHKHMTTLEIENNQIKSNLINQGKIRLWL